MSVRSRGGTVIHSIRTGPRWRVVVVIVIVAVAVYGIYSAWESSQRNGRRLDQALAALQHSNATNDKLVLVINAQGKQVEALRKALKNLGLTDAQINKAIRQAGGNPDAPTLPPGCTMAGCSPDGGGGNPPPSDHPSHHPSPSPSHRPSPHPSHHPSPSPTPCNAVNPLTGKCILRTPLPHLPSPLALPPWRPVLLMPLYFRGVL